MRGPPNKVVERYRVREGRLASCSLDGNNGAFQIPHFSDNDPKKKVLLVVIASDGAGWEHVSVSLGNRTPTWAEMCYVKDLFFEPEETVMQLHPPKSDWRSLHDYCLHLWRPTDASIPLPPGILVAPSIDEIRAIKAGTLKLDDVVNAETDETRALDA